MRLIDAEAFATKLEETITNRKYDDFYTDKVSVGEILRSVVVDLRGEGIRGFELAPTVEINTVEPIKRLIAKYEKSIECIEESMNDLDDEGGAVYGNLCALKEIYEGVIADLRGVEE